MINPAPYADVLSFSAGFLLMTVNLVLLWVAVVRLLQKKLIALGLPAIVLKYALVGVCLFYAMNHPQLKLVPFFVGMSLPVIFAVTLLARGTLKSGTTERVN